MARTTHVCAMRGGRPLIALGLMVLCVGVAQTIVAQGVSTKPRVELMDDPELDDQNTSEGDTSIFMNLLDNGLRASEDPTYGGWGGRRWTDHDASGATPADYAAARWFGPAQQDFAARLKWTVTPTYAGANHAPSIKVDRPLNLSAAPGQAVRLRASASDPDGNPLACKWWQYTDAGT